MTQFGFYFNQNECIGCRVCQVACCDRNNLEAGTTLRTVTSYETGTYPEASIYHFAASAPMTAVVLEWVVDNVPLVAHFWQYRPFSRGLWQKTGEVSDWPRQVSPLALRGLPPGARAGNR